MLATKAFKNGNSQAIRIPAEIAYASVDINLVIERVGDEIRIRPAQRRIANFLGVLQAFSPDFMSQGRIDDEQEERDSL
jgi:antitoxin VapB